MGNSSSSASGASGPEQQQPQDQDLLLVAHRDGSLRVVSLEPDSSQAARVTTLPLPQGLRPHQLALHAPTGMLLLLGSQPHTRAMLQPAHVFSLHVLQPQSGE